MFNIKNYLGLLRHFVFPQHCPVCGKIAVAYCDECLESAAEHFAPFCSECGGSWQTSQCRDAFPCCFAAVYGGAAKEFLLNLKYKNSRSLGIPMGRLMGTLFCKAEADVILPVPLHIKSSRAFNQSELLALGISQIWKIPVETPLYWSEEYGRQVEKNAGERKALPVTAIKSSPLYGKRVIIVDDVYTTGSTVKAAAEAVKNAGSSVVAACFWCRAAKNKNSEEFSDIINALTLEIG